MVRGKEFKSGELYLKKDNPVFMFMGSKFYPSSIELFFFLPNGMIGSRFFSRYNNSNNPQLSEDAIIQGIDLEEIKI